MRTDSTLHSTGFIVLAGGKSRRMGTNKADLPLEGGTFLTHILHKAEELGFGEILISGYSGENAALRERAVPDVFPNCGPLGGLHACLLRTTQAACFVMSVDMPTLQADLIRSVVHAHAQQPHGITVVRADALLEPLIGVYAASLAPQIEVLLRQRIYAVSALIRSQPHSEFAYSGACTALRNINTPSEYDGLLTEQRANSGD